MIRSVPNWNMAMPESERECFDVDDWAPWDFDNNTLGEADTQDLLSDEDSDN